MSSDFCVLFLIRVFSCFPLPRCLRNDSTVICNVLFPVGRATYFAVFETAWSVFFASLSVMSYCFVFFPCTLPLVYAWVGEFVFALYAPKYVGAVVLLVHFTV